VLNQNFALLYVNPNAVVFIVYGEAESRRNVSSNNGYRCQDPRLDRMLRGHVQLNRRTTCDDIQQILRISDVLAEEDLRVREQLETAAAFYQESGITVGARENRLRGATRSASPIAQSCPFFSVETRPDAATTRAASFSRAEESTSRAEAAVRKKLTTARGKRWLATRRSWCGANKNPGYQKISWRRAASAGNIRSGLGD
jgi:hypothetical protein